MLEYNRRDRSSHPVERNEDVFTPYQIRCLTCNATLKVGSEDLVGEILTCPRCHSMVLVAAPTASKNGERKDTEVPAETDPISGSKIANTPQEDPIAVPALAVTAPPIPTVSTPEDSRRESPTANGPTIPKLPTAPKTSWPPWLLFTAATTLGVLFTASVWAFLKANPIGRDPGATGLVPVADVAQQVQKGEPQTLEDTHSQTPATKSTSPRARPQDENVRGGGHAPPAAPTEEVPDLKTPANAEPTQPTKPPRLQTGSAATDQAKGPQDPQTSRRIQLPGPNPDIAARMEMPLEQIRFPDIPLGRALAVLSELTGIPIVTDRVALRDRGLSLESSVQFQANQERVSNILTSLLRDKGLVFIATENQLIITSAESGTAPQEKKTYPINHLIHSHSSPTDVARLVQQLITPASWEDPNNPAELRLEGTTLQVRQTPLAQHAIETFLRRLEYARELALLGEQPTEHPERASLATRWQRAEPLLQRPLSCGTSEPLLLSNYLARLAYRAKINILLDEVEILRTGRSSSTKITANSKRQPLETLLTTAVEPLGLTWRVIDEKTIEVTSPSKVEETAEIEFYRLPASVAGNPEQFVANLRQQVAPDRWFHSGGEGRIVFDRPSGFLIVQQAQPIQREVAAYLQQHK